jgi:hypothetical protein
VTWAMLAFVGAQESFQFGANQRIHSSSKMRTITHFTSRLGRRLASFTTCHA